MLRPHEGQDVRQQTGHRHRPAAQQAAVSIVGIDSSATSGATVFQEPLGNGAAATGDRRRRTGRGRIVTDHVRGAGHDFQLRVAIQIGHRRGVDQLTAGLQFAAAHVCAHFQRKSWLHATVITLPDVQEPIQRSDDDLDATVQVDIGQGRGTQQATLGVIHVVALVRGAVGRVHAQAQQSFAIQIEHEHPTIGSRHHQFRQEITIQIGCSR